MSSSLGIGLYGINGHQIEGRLAEYPGINLAAVAAFPESRLSAVPSTVARCAGLSGLIAHPAVDLIVLCSPRRADQADDAIACLEGGKHVLAEKPCALEVTDLDRILEAAGRTGRIFHEMAASAFLQPFASLFALVRQGVIGPVRQIHAQKSYPLFDQRPDDPAIDGGMFLQAGIHAARWIDHGLDREIFGGVARQVRNREGRVVAASALLDLGSAVAGTLTVNYLNAGADDRWGDETLRVWGEDGFLAIEAGGRETHWVEKGKRRGGIPIRPETAINWFSAVLEEIRHGGTMPISLARELRPLRGLLSCTLPASAEA